MTIYDLFPVNDELSMVVARLAAMRSAGVHHLAVEGDITFRGTPKPYHLLAWQRTHHDPDLTVIGLPLTPDPDPWVVEAEQRNSLLGLAAASFDPKPDDLILSCDADEIVRPSALERIMEATEAGPVVLAMRHHWYSPGWIDPAPWLKARAFRWRDRPAELHNLRLAAMPTVPDAGWHFSWFGGPEAVHTKLRSFSHAEYDVPAVHGSVEELMQLGVALTGLRLTRYDGNPADFPPLKGNPDAPLLP